MSYTPDDQKIEDPVLNLRKAIKEFNDVVQARIESCSYGRDHTDALHEIRKDLLDVEYKINKL